MKGRPKRTRRISGMPAVSGFVPYGRGHHGMDGETIFLLYEEYEALKLLDYEKHTQEEAAGAMGVSRPTLTRIYMRVREKIATAFVEGRKMVVEGGKVELDGNWYECAHCGAIFSAPQTTDGAIDGTSGAAVPQVCALCGSKLISRYLLGAAAQE